MESEICSIASSVDERDSEVQYDDDKHLEKSLK